MSSASRRPGASASIWILVVSCAAPAPVATEVVYIQPSGAAPVPTLREVVAPAREHDAHEPFDQSSPERAVRSFARAYADGRYDVIMRFIPKAQLVGPDGLDEQKLRAAWAGSAEVEHKFAELSASLRSGPPNIERTGERATMAYGAGGTVQLFVEDGVWKIDDL
jgi:hypothetical protein